MRMVYFMFSLPLASTNALYSNVNKIVDETVVRQGMVCIFNAQLSLRSWQTKPILEFKPVAHLPTRTKKKHF